MLTNLNQQQQEKLAAFVESMRPQIEAEADARFMCGDLVRVRDGSYSMAFEDGVHNEQLHPAWDRCRLSNDWKVVAIGCVLPIRSYGETEDGDVPRNDTVLLHKSGCVLFTQERFLELIDA